jgi:hypothetical protein
MPALWLATAQNMTLAAVGRAAHKARARGTLAKLAGEQAAEGQTASTRVGASRFVQSYSFWLSDSSELLH